ncbi:MAG: hypothetical protein AAFR96_02270 [Planctomycetota bacterium]
MRFSASRAGVIGMLAVSLTGGLVAADAEAQRGDRGRHHAGHDHDGFEGTLRIGRDRHAFRYHRDPCRSLADVLIGCGFDAWVSDGCVHVRYRGRRPSFVISAPGFSFGFTFGRDVLTIRPISGFAKHDRFYGPRHRVRCAPRRDWHPVRHRGWHRDPQSGWHRGWHRGWGHRWHGHGYRVSRHAPKRCR